MRRETKIIRNCIAVSLTVVLVVGFESSNIDDSIDHAGFWFLIPILLALVGQFAVVGSVLLRLLHLNSIPLLVWLFFLPDALAPSADPEAFDILAYYVGYWMFAGSVAFLMIVIATRLLRRLIKGSDFDSREL